MFKNVVTLYIEDTSIRLLTAQGKQIKKWAELPIESGLIEGATVIKEAEVATKIEHLLKTHKIRTKKIIIGVSGLSCLTRPIALPKLPKAMLAETINRQAEKLLPVALEELYISWQTIPSTDDKTRVFVTAVRRKNTDSLLKMLRKVNIKPHLMDLKPLALAKLAKEPTAIIIDVQSNEFDIIIMANGVPHPIRTIPFPRESQSPQDKLLMIADDLDKTIKFYNSNNQENPLDSDIPIYVSGELTNKLELWQSLSDEIGHPVLSLPSPLSYPEQLDPSRYMVNIGLALKELRPCKKACPSVVNLNTLPAIYRPEPPSLARIIAVPSAIVICGLLFLMTMLVHNTSANTHSIRSQLNVTSQFIEQKLLERQELTADIAELEKNVVEVESSLNNFTTALDRLDKQHMVTNTNLRSIARMLPNTMQPTNINFNYESSTLTIKGKSPNQADVSSYAKRLDSTLKLYEVTVARIKVIDNEETEFTLVLRLRK